MARMIFVNLPVKDLEKAKAFYTALGFDINPQFTDNKAACIVISEHIFAMLLTEPFFKTFTAKSICDTANSTEVLLCLSCENRSEVDALVRKAVAAGGSTYNDPQDHGFMYAHGFQDVDGHLWECAWMDPAAVEK